MAGKDLVMRWQLRRACDRCHVLKARCQWVEGSDQCQRCTHLQVTCCSKRVGKRGDRRLRPLPASTSPDRSPSSPSDTSALGVPRGISVTDKFDSEELQLFERMLFYDDRTPDVFLVGPSFWGEFRGFLMTRLISSRDTLRDAYALSAITRTSTFEGALAEKEKRQCYQKAARSISVLRSLKVADVGDISQTLLLGALIMTFTIRFRVQDSYKICVHTLGLIKDAYEKTSKIEPENMEMASSMILAEMPNCFVAGRAPTLRFRPKFDHPYVDKFVGLCAPLLPILYDLCKLNSLLSRTGQSSPKIKDQLEQLELAALGFKATFPPGYETSFTADEKERMLCQAQVLRKGVLLIIHRIQHPYGTEDEPAQQMAVAILEDLDAIVARTGSKVMFVETAFTVAFFELKKPEDREYWLAQLHKLVGYSSQHQSLAKYTFVAFWATKDSSRQSMYYYDIAKTMNDVLGRINA